jgi:predicted nucleic acid-binding protein
MGLIVLDAGVLIGVLDGTDVHHVPATEALRVAEENLDQLALPTSALAEILVGPCRRGPDAVASVYGLLATLTIDLVAIDQAIAREAAVLRAKTSLRLPDAFVIASAIVLRADRLLSTDGRWPAAVADSFRGAIQIIGQ